VGRSTLEPVGEERSSAITGFLAEALPPVGLPVGITTVVDRSLERDAVLYFPGGEVRSVLKIRGTDLVHATEATVADIAVPAPRERPAGR
jgi:prolyl-tRNA editing enzyme YbaK/EbsC (Cys-tRNA(Pro) deacylase)